MTRTFGLALAALFLSGCAGILPEWANIDYARNESEFAVLEGKAPIIKPVSDLPKLAPTDPAKIEVYYYIFKPMGTPDAVIDWERLYVIGKGTSPKYSYSKLARIAIYRREIDDAGAIRELQGIAASMGADAIINVLRAPQDDVTRTSGNTNPFLSGTYARPIMGYAYAGMAIRKNK